MKGILALTAVFALIVFAGTALAMGGHGGGHGGSGSSYGHAGGPGTHMLGGDHGMTGFSDHMNGLTHMHSGASRPSQAVHAAGTGPHIARHWNQGNGTAAKTNQ